MYDYDLCAFIAMSIPRANTGTMNNPAVTTDTSRRLEYMTVTISAVPTALAITMAI